FCSGWLGGTQCDSLSSTVLSCADAADASPNTIAASAAAPILIDILPGRAWARVLLKGLLVMLHNDRANVNAKGLLHARRSTTAKKTCARALAGGRHRRAHLPDRLHAAARADRGIPGRVPRLRDGRHPAGAVLRAHGDRPQSRAYPVAGR